MYCLIELFSSSTKINGDIFFDEMFLYSKFIKRRRSGFLDDSSQTHETLYQTSQFHITW